ncbi:CSC1-like protein RXW8 [Canna indica]|uniref:CSC1-like protein RXW8 n=1 Tax=Canna indica TaxID=4628 RepID=A0AAQ3QMR4_9LILI|nr:CSC1-like protein RXW8 [Canna indica]
MKLSALLTSAGINIGFSALFFCLYSILRKQPGNLYVYFGRRLNQDENDEYSDPFTLERFVPSASWIVKAWELSEEELLSIGGLDAVVFLRIFVFSIRVFSIAAIVCVFGVLPVNYYGQAMQHKYISAESLDVFTIANIQGGSSWLWVHCIALYIITLSTCSLLFSEYRAIAKLKLDHITGSPPNPCHFTILVRSIPKSPGLPLNEIIKNFFINYHGLSYLSHQIIRRRGRFQKIMVQLKEDRPQPSRYSKKGNVFHSIAEQMIHFHVKLRLINGSLSWEQECSAAFVFFKTRYAAIVASKVLHTSNPMVWVTEMAPAPNDVYWPNLWIPYGQLWIRRIATLLASILFMFMFLIPVTFVQGLTQLEQLQQILPLLKIIPNTDFVIQFVSGYLPSFILSLFLYSVPPTMMLFSTVEGPTSRSEKKRSACCKILYFTIWNVFFVNVLSGSVISQLNVISSPKEIPAQLAKAVPRQATFFITYVLTLGWTSLSTELMQLCSLLLHSLRKYVLGSKEDPTFVPTFPYHTEVPRVLLFGLLGFTCSILAPLILPVLLVYFFLGYLVYRNQVNI